MIFKKYWDSIYKFELIFIADATHEEVNKRIKKYHVPFLPESFSGNDGAFILINPDEHKGMKYWTALLWIRKKKDFYALLHELVHMVIDVFENRSIEITTATTEPFAYYLESWFKKLWRVVNKN